ncbi:acyl-CoA thioesterase [Reichenbachiella agarivorans]|uniref:Acyl-CoA thioesterase n=1 Tax=Reichenbachiella agarivorans TaxID=2979464 RepID=A0ABY6CSF4_9BACT|nr:acyl-CoA thioesterase [Reichenbachiella agarivorans]UXP31215.1 acyl-CoA thioesterase [Reichenbachiella agarivorans]
MNTQKAKPVNFSKTTITELMIPSYANFGGKIHGGILLSLIDKVAYACASKHAGNYCVTVSVDNVDFLEPVEVGDLVHLRAAVVHVGNSSLVVGINVIAENVKENTVKKTNNSYVTMVAKGDDDKPTQVPALILESQEEVRLFLEAIKRKELKKDFRSKIKEVSAVIMDEAHEELLQHERCVLDLKKFTL